MISEKQLDANRRNAQLSTGPQTPEGRAAVRHNALTHGLTAQYAVLPQENILREFRAKLEERGILDQHSTME